MECSHTCGFFYAMVAFLNPVPAFVKSDGKFWNKGISILCQSWKNVLINVQDVERYLW
jgi:hypothetical protein